MQVLYFGRAPRTKETLPDFLKWHRTTRHPLVFRGLTGSQRTPGNGASQKVWLLSRNKGDPTLGSLRDKKENCSTRRGLRVGTGFVSFLQTPRGRGFSLLVFYSRFKYFTNV